MVMSPEQADAIADLNLGGTTRNLGTLLYAAWSLAEFVLSPEAWPVYCEWMKANWATANYPGLLREGRLELEDMRDVMRQVGLAGTA
jgi:hypothetical protein